MCIIIFIYKKQPHHLLSCMKLDFYTWAQNHLLKVPPRIPMYEHTPAAEQEKTNMRARMCAFRKHTLHASATGRRDRV